jgi:hypothetical protein
VSGRIVTVSPKRGEGHLPPAYKRRAAARGIAPAKAASQRFSVLDSAGRPAAVIELTEVRVVPSRSRAMEDDTAVR